MGKINTKDAEVLMSLVSIMVLLDLASLDDVIEIMSSAEDVAEVSGGYYVGKVITQLVR